MFFSLSSWVLLIAIGISFTLWLQRRSLGALYRALKVLLIVGLDEAAAEGEDANPAGEVLHYLHPGLSQQPYRLVLPTGRSNGFGIIIFHGASPYAENHPVISNLGEALSHVGYTVYIPRMPKLQALEIDASTTETIGAIYRHIVETHAALPGQISLIGTSFSGASLLKAEASDVWGPVAPGQILTFGTYCNLENTLRFVLTGRASHGDEVFTIEPDPWGQIIFFHNYLDHIQRDFDAIQVRDVLEHYLEGNKMAGEEARAELTGRDRDLIDRIVSPNSAAALELAEEIIDHARPLMESLSVASFGKQIARPVWVLHGEQDRSIPFTEALALGSELGDRAHLFIAGHYGHKIEGAEIGLIQRTRQSLGMLIFMARFFRSVNIGTRPQL